MSYEGPSAGTAKSVALSLPGEFAVTGSPVTSTGTLTAAWQPQANNLIFCGPSAAGPAAPTFRFLVAGDVPNLDAAKITSGLLDVARMGSGTADAKHVLAGNNTWIRGPYSLVFGSTVVHNPADSTTYYVGQIGQATTTTPDTRRVLVPLTGTIVAAIVSVNAVTAVGTNESWTFNIRVNNTTSTLIANVAANTIYRAPANSALSIAVNAGDAVELEVVCPAWVTNPQGVTYWVTLVIMAS